MRLLTNEQTNVAAQALMGILGKAGFVVPLDVAAQAVRKVVGAIDALDVVRASSETMEFERK